MRVDGYHIRQCEGGCERWCTMMWRSKSKTTTTTKGGGNLEELEVDVGSNDIPVHVHARLIFHPRHFPIVVI
jgi:hypothetical protein